MTKILHITSGTRKTLKRENKNFKKSLERNNINKVLYFYFFVWNFFDLPHNWIYLL